MLTTPLDLLDNAGLDSMQTCGLRVELPNLSYWFLGDWTLVDHTEYPDGARTNLGAKSSEVVAVLRHPGYPFRAIDRDFAYFRDSQGVERRVPSGVPFEEIFSRDPESWEESLGGSPRPRVFKTPISLSDFSWVKEVCAPGALPWVFHPRSEEFRKEYPTIPALPEGFDPELEEVTPPLNPNCRPPGAFLNSFGMSSFIQDANRTLIDGVVVGPRVSAMVTEEDCAPDSGDYQDIRITAVHDWWGLTNSYSSLVLPSSLPSSGSQWLADGVSFTLVGTLINSSVTVAHLQPVCKDFGQVRWGLFVEFPSSMTLAEALSEFCHNSGPLGNIFLGPIRLGKSISVYLHEHLSVPTSPWTPINDWPWSFSRRTPLRSFLREVPISDFHRWFSLVSLPSSNRSRILPEEFQNA